MSDDNPITVSQKTIRRKIQVVGGNTITVSLPRAWADKNRLGRDTGQEQEIEMRYMADGSLLLSPANANLHHVERIRIHQVYPESSLDMIKRIIIADFMGGIDMISIRSKKSMSSILVNDVREFVDKRIIGFDLIETESGFDIINMTQSPKFPVDRLLEIIRVQSTKMMERCYTWLMDPSIDRQQLIREMQIDESSLDKRSNQLIRTLQLSVLDYWMAEQVNLPMAEILYWSTTVKSAENASDLAVAVTEVAPSVDLDKIDKDIVEDVFELGKSVTDLYSKALKAFIDHDHEMAHEILEEQMKHAIVNQQNWPVETANELEGSILLVVRHLEKIGVHARRIAEAVIDCEAARIAYAAIDQT